MPKKKEIQITVLSSRLEVSTKRKNLFYSPRKALDELPVGKASRERYLLGSALVDYGDLVDASDGASEIVKTDAVQSSCYLEILEEEDSDSDDDDDDYAASCKRFVEETEEADPFAVDNAYEAAVDSMKMPPGGWHVPALDDDAYLASLDESPDASLGTLEPPPR